MEIAGALSIYLPADRHPSVTGRWNDRSRVSGTAVTTLFDVPTKTMNLIVDRSLTTTPSRAHR
jgi:hypothetical protein